jgi:hypothetical protein
MDSIKEIWGTENLRLCRSTAAWAIVLWVALVSGAGAETCIAPVRPFVPSDQKSVQEYRDFIQRDFEFYIQEIQEYFGCLDAERTRAFEEAREVSEEYGAFLDHVTQ